jgi:hypothetical protein
VQRSVALRAAGGGLAPLTTCPGTLASSASRRRPRTRSGASRELFMLALQCAGWCGCLDPAVDDTGLSGRDGGCFQDGFGSRPRTTARLFLGTGRGALGRGEITHQNGCRRKERAAARPPRLAGRPSSAERLRSPWKCPAVPPDRRPPAAQALTGARLTQQRAKHFADTLAASESVLSQAQLERAAFGQRVATEQASLDALVVLSRAEKHASITAASLKLPSPARVARARRLRKSPEVAPGHPVPGPRSRIRCRLLFCIRFLAYAYNSLQSPQQHPQQLPPMQQPETV